MLPQGLPTKSIKTFAGAGVEPASGAYGAPRKTTSHPSRVCGNANNNEVVCQRIYTNNGICGYGVY